MKHSARTLSAALVASTLAIAAPAVPAVGVTFDLSSASVSGLNDKETFTEGGLDLFVQALNIETTGGDDAPLVSSGGLLGGLGINTGPTQDDPLASVPGQNGVLDTDGHDEAFELTFSRPLTSLSITIFGAGEYEVFSAPRSEIGGLPTPNSAAAGSYLNRVGSGDGDHYGNGLDEGENLTPGGMQTGAALEERDVFGNIAAMVSASRTIIITDFDQPFFVVSGSDSNDSGGLSFFALSEVQATFVPVPAGCFGLRAPWLVATSPPSRRLVKPPSSQSWRAH